MIGWLVGWSVSQSLKRESLLLFLIAVKLIMPGQHQGQKFKSVFGGVQSIICRVLISRIYTSTDG